MKTVLAVLIMLAILSPVLHTQPLPEKGWIIIGFVQIKKDPRFLGLKDRVVWRTAPQFDIINQTRAMPKAGDRMFLEADFRIVEVKDDIDIFGRLLSSGTAVHVYLTKIGDEAYGPYKIRAVWALVSPLIR